MNLRWFVVVSLHHSAVQYYCGHDGRWDFVISSDMNIGEFVAVSFAPLCCAVVAEDYTEEQGYK
jgi:hypothetical protein